MSITLSAIQKQRRDTAANWTAENPTLLAGEIGIESDTGKIKIGNGSSAWTALAYTTWSQLSAYPIVNADVATNAAIAGTKISPNFGSQNVTTTGTATAASFIPTSSTAPANGVYLPAANSVALATNGSGRLFVNSSGSVGIGSTGHGNPSNYLLDVANTGSQFVRCITTDTTATASVGSFRAEFLGGSGGANTSVELRAGNGYTYLTSTTNHALLFGTNTTERLRITSTGTVNIVGAGTAGSTQAISFNGSAPVNSLVVDSSGRVGIGTTSPGTQLDVVGNSRVIGTASLVPTFILQAGSGVTDGFSRGTLDFLDQAGTSGYRIRGNHDGGVFQILTNASGVFSERVSVANAGTTTFTSNASTAPLIVKISASEVARIDSSGRLLVGTSSGSSLVTIDQTVSRAALSTTAPARLYTGTGTITDNTTAASGTVTHGTIVAFDNPAIASTNATVTYTNASTVYIDGAPTNGTNVTITNGFALFVAAGASRFGGSVLSNSATAGIGYATGAGGAVTQATNRTTGVTLNNICGSITLVSAAGTTSWQTFTVTNSTVAATDTVRVCQQSGTDKYLMHVTKVAAGSFDITYATTGGTTTEQPVFNFSVLKAVAA